MRKKRKPVFSYGLWVVSAFRKIKYYKNSIAKHLHNKPSNDRCGLGSIERNRWEKPRTTSTEHNKELKLSGFSHMNFDWMWKWHIWNLELATTINSKKEKITINSFELIASRALKLIHCYYCVKQWTVCQCRYSCNGFVSIKKWINKLISNNIVIHQLIKKQVESVAFASQSQLSLSSRRKSMGEK